MPRPLRQVIDLDAGARKFTDLGLPTLSTDFARKGYFDGELGYATSSDKALVPSATSGDDEDTGLTISDTPARKSYVRVLVNGLTAELGDGVKTKDCYFSGDTGSTARAIEDIVSGDALYWNGVISGFDLDGSDEIDLGYLIAAVNTGFHQGSRIVMFDARSTAVPGTVTGAVGEVFNGFAPLNDGKFVSVASFVPADTVSIIFHVTWTVTSGRNMSLIFRKPGTAEAMASFGHNSNVSTSLREANGDFGIVSLDSSRQFESYVAASGATSISGMSHALYIMGYTI